MGAGIGEPESICRTGSFPDHHLPGAVVECHFHGPEASQGFEKLSRKASGRPAYIEPNLLAV